MGEKGVSPVVASVILLLFILGVLTPLLVNVIGSIAAPENPRLRVSLEFRLGENENMITLVHGGGDPILSAFVIDKGKIKWNRLEVRLDGVKKGAGDASLNGNDDFGIADFMPGDELVFSFDKPIEAGKELTVIYPPTGQVLLKLAVPPFR